MPSGQSVSDLMPALGQPVLVCATKATVIRDLHKPAPYTLTGDVVGHANALDDEAIVLVGWTFAVEIKLADVRAWWHRRDAPDPCPNCGGTG